MCDMTQKFNIFGADRLIWCIPSLTGYSNCFNEIKQLSAASDYHPKVWLKSLTGLFTEKSLLFFIYFT